MVRVHRNAESTLTKRTCDSDSLQPHK